MPCGEDAAREEEPDLTGILAPLEEEPDLAGILGLGAARMADVLFFSSLAVLACAWFLPGKSANCAG